jgi:hypothetical protein
MSTPFASLERVQCTHLELLIRRFKSSVKRAQIRARNRESTSSWPCYPSKIMPSRPNNGDQNRPVNQRIHWMSGRVYGFQAAKIYFKSYERRSDRAHWLQRRRSPKGRLVAFSLS